MISFDRQLRRVVDRAELQHEEEIEREERVQHIAQVGIRRIMQQGLAKGWTAWHDKWVTLSRQRNLLKASAGRLMKPRLAAAVAVAQGLGGCGGGA